MALIDAQGVVVGVGLGGMRRPDVAASLNKTRDDFGWTGYVDLQRLARQPSPRLVYAAVMTPRGWIRLRDSKEIGRQF
jgi:hypothetical protein